MILLNLAHPLTEYQRKEIELLTQQNLERVMDIPVQLDNTLPYAEQIRQLVSDIPLDAQQWQTEAILINPPAYNYAALTLFAELHGKMGYFPSIIRIRPAEDSVPTRFEVCEIINLQVIRDAARETRKSI